VTFAKACSHITNYTSGHETLAHVLGSGRTAYPDNHIEVDNRLSRMLGRLEWKYGNRAFYANLTRNPKDVVKSFARRGLRQGIMGAYACGRGIITGRHTDSAAVATDLVETILANVGGFLRDKTHGMTIEIERAKERFQIFWDAIKAEGDLTAALAEFDINYNASDMQ